MADRLRGKNWRIFSTSTIATLSHNWAYLLKILLPNFETNTMSMLLLSDCGLLKNITTVLSIVKLYTNLISKSTAKNFMSTQQKLCMLYHKLS